MNQNHDSTNEQFEIKQYIQKILNLLDYLEIDKSGKNFNSVYIQWYKENELYVSHSKYNSFMFNLKTLSMTEIEDDERTSFSKEIFHKKVEINFIKNFYKTLHDFSIQKIKDQYDQQIKDQRVRSDKLLIDSIADGNKHYMHKNDQLQACDFFGDGI